mmetsp:Transcript_10306/g.11841  ORF Transcript_10306/g.11841 Transcript_10306/m.11841 type:complete len:171 (-) Transcript_10306:46-558(-)
MKNSVTLLHSPGDSDKMKKKPAPKVDDEPRRRKQNSEAARRFRAKRKREIEELRHDHLRLSQSRVRMIESIIRLKALLHQNKIKVPDLGLEDSDIALPEKGAATIDALTSAGGRAPERRRDTVMPPQSSTVSRDAEEIKAAINKVEERLMRRLRVVIEKVKELGKTSINV